MKNIKLYAPLWGSTKSENVPLCERTDLTDEQRSKHFNVDERYAIASGGISDSIWAPGNEGKLRNRKRSTIPPSPGDRAEDDKSKLSPTAGTFKSEAATMPAAVSPIRSSSMTAGIENGQNTSPWSAQQSQTYLTAPSRMAATVPSRQEPVHGDGNTSYVPPHLRGIEHPGQASLPAVTQNPQYNVAPKPNKSTETNITPPSLTTPQTPQQKKASTAVPLWHVSPESKAKRSRDSYTSAASMEANRSSTTNQKTIIDHERGARLPYAPSDSQEETFSTFVNNKKSDEDTKVLDLPGVTERVKSSAAPQVALSVISPATTQIPHTQRAVHENNHPHSSVDNTDDFLAFLLKKEKDTPTNGKRYIAINTAPQPKGAVADVKHEGESSTAILNTRKENIPILPATHIVSCTPTGFTAVTHSDMVLPSNIPAEVTDNVRNGADFSDPQTGHEAVSSAAAAGNGQGDAYHRSEWAIQNNDNSNNFARQVSHGWEDTRLLSAKDIQKALLTEIMAYNPLNPEAPHLTEELLMQKGGWAPRVRSEDSFCDRVSDAGVKVKKENVRASQGISAADELLNRQKSWYPLDWGYDRYSLDLGFIPKYIREDWLPFVPHGSAVTVDTSSEGFIQGKLPVNDRVLCEEVIQPDCIPDIANSENEVKRLRQTAELDATVLTQKRKKRYRNAELQAAESEARYREIATLELAPHPYAPAIAIYLRPVTSIDATGIKSIYNYYVKNSIIPEDQAEVLEEDIAGIIKLCQQEKLPCIVAIKGTVPTLQPPGRHGKSSSKPLLPQFETIVGFGFAQTYGYGIGGARSGRSRTTAELQFYVHHEYTRKGIGRSLLDRLIQSLSHSYAAKDGYNWINPKDDPIYNSPRLWHQLIIQLPVEVKDDATLPWFSEFLAKYWFDQEARLKRFARSSVYGSQARFLDVVVFAKTSSIEVEHPSFL